eukprot:CAMPEP_0206024438 /NCGR_PEP_ID=MMETSP1464-20131121/38178_1 /ASSEMBLY_ACC=CAM_ASM_001124 /TAXON_ID=119497 /ORGANISM="Exanthemachrysis gayraliae, Strain RCC1523" /LENGTH=90 /DNA_ID=CAMNT_0053398447 /DNA_START=45 /DNA_END=313 /DNA_ORIENTATION=+
MCHAQYCGAGPVGVALPGAPPGNHWRQTARTGLKVQCLRHAGGAFKQVQRRVGQPLETPLPPPRRACRRPSPRLQCAHDRTARGAARAPR